jgi:hypothetical protein
VSGNVRKIVIALDYLIKDDFATQPDSGIVLPELSGNSRTT